MCSDSSIALDFFFYGDNRFAVSNRLVDIFYLKDEVLNMLKTYPDLSRKQAQSLADQFEVYGWNDPEHKDEEACWKPVIITARSDQNILLGAAVVLTQLPAFTSYAEFKNSMNRLLGKASYASSLKSRIQQLVLKKCHACEIPTRQSGDYLRDSWNQFYKTKPFNYLQAICKLSSPDARGVIRAILKQAKVLSCSNIIAADAVTLSTVQMFDNLYRYAHLKDILRIAHHSRSFYCGELSLD
jgi:hypothetical protein